METERIKSPEGVKQLMEELWLKHKGGKSHSGCNVYMVDLPEPTEEEKRIMAENRANRKPVVIEVEKLQEALSQAGEKLGGW